MSWLWQFWASVTKASDKLIEAEHRQKASLLSGLLFALTIFLFFANFFLLAFSPRMTLTIFFVNLGVNLVYLFCYLISRTAYYRWSARLFIWIATIGIYAFYFTIQLSIQERILTSLIVVMILSGLTLSRLETIVNFFLLEASLIAVLLLAGDETGTVFYLPVIIAWTGILTIVSSSMNTRFSRRAEESEARYRELMNANSEGILIIQEADAKILDANPAAAKILGYDANELIGRYPIEFITTDSKELIRKAWENREKGIPIEAEALHRDGGVVYIEATLKPYNYLNRAAYVLTLIDISERKQVEALVIESEHRFRAIFNESSHFIGVLDITGKILELNEQSYAVFGLEAMQSIGKSLWDVRLWAHSEASKERVKEVVSRAAKGEFIRYEIQARDRDDLPIYLDFSIKPVWDSQNNVSMLITDSRDITAYKLAEQKRVEYERRYDSLFKNTADAVFIINLDNTLITANKKALEILGCTAEEIEGKHSSVFIVPEELAEAVNVIERLKAGASIPPVYERRLRRMNGEVFPAEITIMMVYDYDNKPMYIQSMVRDLSERARLEQQRFEIAVERERSQMLTRFIEHASHHFRTPITNVKTSLYLLPRMLENQDKREHHIRVVNQELERLQFLLDDLLTVLRLQKSTTEFSLGRIHISQLFSEIQGMQIGRNYYANYQWHWEDSSEDELVIGDKSMLAKAILNLIDNAVRYTEKGGSIRVETYQQDNWLAIDVIDTGHGIHEAELPHIFEDFYRTSHSQSLDSSRSGLGLSICKAIVERHQGIVHVHSKVGEGSHFQIILPLFKHLGSGLAKPPQEMLVRV